MLPLECFCHPVFSAHSRELGISCQFLVCTGPSPRIWILKVSPLEPVGSQLSSVVPGSMGEMGTWSMPDTLNSRTAFAFVGIWVSFALGAAVTCGNQEQIL